MGEQHANGWRVSRHRLVADATVGVIANPMSGRDIRRLVTSASVFPALFDGELQADPRSSGGFRVRARLPYKERPR